MGNLEGTPVLTSCVRDNKYTENEATKVDEEEVIDHTASCDPRLGLTKMQLFKLKKSWKGIHREMVPTGVEMFIGLFQEGSDLRELFTTFSNISGDEELRNSEVLENHGLLVMNALDDAIQNVDDVDKMVAKLHAVGATHIQFATFHSKLFQHMEQPFLTSVKLTLGDRYSEQMDIIYRIVIKFILLTLEEGFTNASGAS